MQDTIFSTIRQSGNAIPDNVQLEVVGVRYDNFGITEEARAEALNIIANEYRNRELRKIPLIGLKKIATVLNVEFNNSYLLQQLVREIEIRLAV